MPISEKEIEKYGSYARAYYYLVRRPKKDFKKSYIKSKNLLPSEDEIKENRPRQINTDDNSYYSRNREKVLQKAKERYRKTVENVERERVISKSDIEEHGTYNSAYYYKVLQPQRVAR